MRISYYNFKKFKNNKIKNMHEIEIKDIYIYIFFFIMLSSRKILLLKKLILTKKNS